MTKQDGHKVKRKPILVVLKAIESDHKTAEWRVKELMAQYRIPPRPGALGPDPLVIRRHGPPGRFKLVDGRHRYEALRRLGQTYVWCVEER